MKRAADVQTGYGRRSRPSRSASSDHRPVELPGPVVALHRSCAAIAAGNTVVLKPSEVAPPTCRGGRVDPADLDERRGVVVTGAVDETTALLAQRFDHIFYTGNGHGRPHRDEGGRRAPDARHARARRQEPGHRRRDRGHRRRRTSDRVGQVRQCRTDVRRPRLRARRRSVEDAVGTRCCERPSSTASIRVPAPTTAASSTSRTWIGCWAVARRSATAVVGGTTIATRDSSPPTGLAGVNPDAPGDGPRRSSGRSCRCSPSATWTKRSASSTIATSRSALYVVRPTRTRSPTASWPETSSGGVAVNRHVFQVSVPDLPFGGVGESGMGAYHGRPASTRSATPSRCSASRRSPTRRSCTRRTRAGSTSSSDASSSSLHPFRAPPVWQPLGAVTRPIRPS